MFGQGLSLILLSSHAPVAASRRVSQKVSFLR